METVHGIPNEFIELVKTIPAPIICDIGSRDATEGLHLLKILKAKELHVFEPNPDSAILCRKNIEEFGQGEISFNEVALSNKNGIVDFFPVNPEKSERTDVGLSSMLIVNPRYTKNRGSIIQDHIKVTTVTLDSYFENRPHPDVLWIDVEGAELLVLQGAKKTLENVKFIHIEVSFRPMHVNKPLFWEIDAELKQSGFMLWKFMGKSRIKGFLAIRKLLPRPPWRWDAVYYKK